MENILAVKQALVRFGIDNLGDCMINFFKDILKKTIYVILLTIIIGSISVILGISYVLIFDGMNIDGTIPSIKGKVLMVFFQICEVMIGFLFSTFLLSKFKNLILYCFIYIVISFSFVMAVFFQETYLIPQYIVNALLYLTIIAFLSMIIFGRLKEK